MNTPSQALQRRPAGPREQWATRGAFLIAGSAMACWAPLVPFAKARLGMAEAGLGLLLLCLGLGSIIAMPVTGLLATRFGCRNVMVLASLVIVAILPALALAPDPLLLGLSLAVFGAAVGTLDVAMNIQAVVVEKDSGRPMMSGFHALFSVGGIVGAGGASLLLGLGWSPLAAMLAASALCLALLAVTAPAYLPYANAESGPATLFAVPHGIVVLLGVLCFIVFLAEGSVLDWSAVYLTGMRNVDPGQAGLGYAAFALAMTAGRFAGDWVVRVLSRPAILLGGGLIAALGFAIVVLVPQAWAAYLGYLLVGLGASNIVPVIFTAAGRQTVMPASLAIATITTIGYLGILMGPAIIGFVAHATSLPAAFALLALGMLAIAASYRIGRT